MTCEQAAVLAKHNFDMTYEKPNWLYHYTNRIAVDSGLETTHMSMPLALMDDSDLELMAKRATALGRSVLSEVTNQLRHKLLIQKMACERSKIEIEPQVMLHRLNNSKRSAFITPRVSVLDFTALPELASAEQTVAFRSELLQHVVHKFNQMPAVKAAFGPVVSEEMMKMHLSNKLVELISFLYPYVSNEIDEFSFSVLIGQFLSYLRRTQWFIYDDDQLREGKWRIVVFRTYKDAESCNELRSVICKMNHCERADVDAKLFPVSLG